jgi:hypothetical protein
LWEEMVLKKTPRKDPKKATFRDQNSPSSGPNLKKIIWKKFEGKLAQNCPKMKQLFIENFGGKFFLVWGEVKKATGDWKIVLI